MDEYGNAGSVAFIERIKHPISVARHVMEKTPHVMHAQPGRQRVRLGCARRSMRLGAARSRDTDRRAPPRRRLDAAGRRVHLGAAFGVTRRARRVVSSPSLTVSW